MIIEQITGALRRRIKIDENESGELYIQASTRSVEADHSMWMHLDPKDEEALWLFLSERHARRLLQCAKSSQ